MQSTFDFAVPTANVADRPPEACGLRRDEIRLLVSDGARGVSDHQFHELPSILDPGDLLLVNDSQTLPAAVPATRQDGDDLLVHLSTRLSDDVWVVELRQPDGPGTRQRFDGVRGGKFQLPDGGSLQLLAPYAVGSASDGVRLWIGQFDSTGRVKPLLDEHGRPIRYGYIADSFPLEAYQTVFARRPGSAEMPSAGRGFTPELLDELTDAGVQTAEITLHTGVSSRESGEPPLPERFDVPRATAEAVVETRERGGRIIAVGTTCVRAIESAVDGGKLTAAGGWTDLVVTPERPPRVVDGLLTGLHEPRSSHLAMLASFLPQARLEADYRRALVEGYRWHEFGDAHLIL